MKRIIAIIFLIVISFGLGEKNEFVPDEAFFQQVVKKYDTDVNLSQYRFRFYEKKPNVNNAAEFYDYDSCLIHFRGAFFPYEGRSLSTLGVIETNTFSEIRYCWE